MRSRFDEQLSILNTELIEMGAMCEQAIALAARALTAGEPELAADVPSISAGIDHKERDIEARCLKLLLQQQPVASDLRQISAALKMITDMERIGDQAEDIAEIVRCMERHTIGDGLEIAEMARETISMVTKSIEAYVKRDVELAESVVEQDDAVDDYFDAVKQRLIGVIAQEPESGGYALDLLMIAKYFERIGDHATNIAEWVVFSVTGKHKEPEGC